MINKKRILIICEGYEEYEYLSKIINLNVWNNYLIDLINAESNGNIFPIYQYNFQNDDYDLILTLTDTDRPTYNDFKTLIEKINQFHGVDNFAEEIVIFGNPCTMQIILNHFSHKTIFITKSSKKKNSPIIELLTGISNYDAHQAQRKVLFNYINLINYEQMKINIANCSTNYENISSTNFLKFAILLESKDTTWIKRINKKLE